MADIVDSHTRSKMMAAIKGRNTTPELLVRRYLHATGLRFRLHDRRLPGSPDVVLPRYKAAVFVNGCFWHQHPGCRFAAMPATRRAFWTAKFESTAHRDRRASEELRSMGWRPIVLWECEASDGDALDRLFWMIVSEL